ncbi:hypothetical protein GHI93_00075 [Lactococcus hircilactis]|uniref:NADPH-dependent FMN reductase-like domain-containing protein n=1 Tax=Lactococcus hircilactis TaxID=1494462 RepID=A0A7X1Z6B3_9LACT|nr:NAD(P)H-dependent oxidoreductase [Lactococcus hircilactis]MQW38351.1 hypothetical protein [Lactococcus hircilactis]
MSDVKLFIIKGSPTTDGTGAQVLQHLKKFLVSLHCEFTVYDQAEFLNESVCNGKLDPFFDASKGEKTAFEDGMLNNDGIIILCPVYIHQMPGSLKNSFDKFSYRLHEFPLLGKKVVIFTYAESNGADYLSTYFHDIFLSMGSEIISVQYNYFVRNTLEEDIEELKKNVSVMCKKIKNNQFVITRKQENLFIFFKKIVLDEIKNGVTSGKQKRWEDLIKYDSLVDYLNSKNFNE